MWADFYSRADFKKSNSISESLSSNNKGEFLFLADFKNIRLH